MSPFFMDGIYPSYRWRSEPQIAVEVTRRIASRGLINFGSGTCSTATLVIPFQQTAFMLASFDSYRKSKQVDHSPGKIEQMLLPLNRGPFPVPQSIDRNLYSSPKVDPPPMEFLQFP